jgi:hypothetical protein
LQGPEGIRITWQNSDLIGPHCDAQFLTYVSQKAEVIPHVCWECMPATGLAFRELCQGELVVVELVRWLACQFSSPVRHHFYSRPPIAWLWLSRQRLVDFEGPSEPWPGLGQSASGLSTQNIGLLPLHHGCRLVCTSSTECR